jgi:hypothetical protein
MKKTIALIVSALTIGLIGNSNVHAETYSFTGASATGSYPANEIDGSTLTIYNDTLTGWSFTAIGLGNFSTPANTSIVSEDITSQNSSGWTGQIDLNYLGVVDIDVTGGSFTSLALQSSIQGNWAAVSAPDGASTFGLLGATLAGLGACRRFLRG